MSADLGAKVVAVVVMFGRKGRGGCQGSAMNGAKHVLVLLMVGKGVTRSRGCVPPVVISVP